MVAHVYVLFPYEIINHPKVGVIHFSYYLVKKLSSTQHSVCHTTYVPLVFAE